MRWEKLEVMLSALVPVGGDKTDSDEIMTFFPFT